MRLTLIAGLLVSLSPGPVYARSVLDDFLNGFEHACTGSKAHQAFVTSLGERYTTSGTLKNKLAIPAEIERAIGPINAVDKGEWTSISVPLKGTFKGLPVSELAFELGNENGIYVETVIFSSPTGTVRRVFGSAVREGNRTIAGKFPDRFPSIAIVSRKGQGQIRCVLSD